ncbi:MAG TPA: thiamine diphosphokinase [Chthonomonas sp.]|uniref:thiamine diphosphokinase n=1 Tax=Chthonomonas sp. TaxID=2282153 RepID=UPI002B4ACF51|nr:thiamine diphosphokinase [Chthonomonas sp.]HLI48861.1 thiamine diphosphokinase [Chthonomonas sp.]
MHVLILANGSPPPHDLAQRLASTADLIIATDGAAAKAFDLGLQPHLICGDFDSIDKAQARQLFPSAEIIVAANQDYADLEKSLQLAKDRGATQVTILGATGGRLDHTLANLALLLSWHQKMGLCIQEADTSVWCLSAASSIPNKHIIPTQPNDIISVIAPEPAIISIRGVLWEADHLLLQPGTRAVSNKALGHSVDVEIVQGTIFLCLLSSSIMETPTP